LNIEKISDIITSLGGKVKGWKDVSERPGATPFAKETEYEFPGIFSGKIHVRNTGDLYVFVISKDVFNWKNKIKELKIKGEVVDAAGGMMWLSEIDENSLEDDLKYLKSYLNELKSKPQAKH